MDSADRAHSTKMSLGMLKVELLQRCLAERGVRTDLGFYHGVSVLSCPYMGFKSMSDFDISDVRLYDLLNRAG